MIKVFEDFNERNVEIDTICKKYGIRNYTINLDGSIDVKGNVNLYGIDLIKLPLKFNRVSGDFNVNRNQLTTLEGSPKYVGRNFTCAENQLTSLEGGPVYVIREYNCSFNDLITLKGAPKEIGDFLCKGNSLLPIHIWVNRDHLKYMIYNQDDYGVWNKDGSFNDIRFEMMMAEKDI